jgi:hypothetical protein
MQAVPDVAFTVRQPNASTSTRWTSAPGLAGAARDGPGGLQTDRYPTAQKRLARYQSLDHPRLLARNNYDDAMQVVFASNAGISRSRARAYIAERRAENPRFSVVDIGGALDPWTDADCFVDLHSVEGRECIIGDVHDLKLWREIAARNFDFCVCSHVLEDIRDPLFVLAKIRETFRHGYLAMPNKHVEFGNIESRHYVGYGHHRWIYTLCDDELRVVAKLPLASYFAPKNNLLLRLRAIVCQNGAHSHGVTPHMRNAGPLRWRDPVLGSTGNELAFIWRGELKFRAINSDFAGATNNDLARIYRDDLAAGL